MLSKQGKILVISDIHGNAEALKAVLKKESDYDFLVFLGDSVLGGPQPKETAEILLDVKPDINIMGNHDEILLDHSLIDNWPEDWRAYNQWALKQIPSEIIEITKTYSFSDKYEIGGVKFFLHHGQLDRSIPAAIPYADTSSFEALDPGNDCELVLFGHNHIQFTHELGSKTYINPGSVGQPRCGRTHACYAVFEDGKYIPRQVTYDQRPWISALDKIDDLRQYPKFTSWLKEGFLAGYGIGKREPWIRFNEEGYF